MMALDPNLRGVLQNLKSDITLTVQLPYLLPFLRQKRLVTETEFQQLSSDGKESDSDKNGKLIRIVIGKGEEAFDLFIEALQEEKEHLGHNSLAKRLLHEQNRLKAEASKPRRSRPEPLPRSKKPATAAATLPAKSIDHEPQQDVNAVKYTLSVQGHRNDPQNSPLIMTDERIMKQLNIINVRLSAVERGVKTIKDDQAVNNVSLEEKLGRAIENIENKLDKLIYSQTEPVYYASTESKVNSPIMLLSSNLQNKDETYVTADSNEYIYETIAETSVKNSDSSDPPYHYVRTAEHKQPLIQKIDREYVEKEKLADGKSGEVWLAVDKKEDFKMVIIKPISKEVFTQEQSALTNISHPNIVRLIDSFMTKSPILIFEYAEKGNLLNCLKSSASSYSPLKLLAISAGVACGMLELEKRAIIHCDVMAKSILIDSNFVCKVASFSKARCLKPGELSYIPPSSITVHIPIKWAAPEILSKRKFSIKSDVWAFGVLLSEVFSQGSTPYPNMDKAKVKSDVQNGIKMAQPSDCPNDVYEVMKSCFEFHAENRPSFAVIHQQLMELNCKSSMSEANSSGSECEDL